MGIRAKKLIQKEFRIIVDQVYTDPLDHPGFKLSFFGFILANFIYLNNMQE